MDITRFKGINNVSDPMRLDMSWLVQADNVNITDTGALTKREGYALSRTGVFLSAYTTLDFSRMYLATALGIQGFTGENLVALTSSNPVYWAEVNEQVFYNNGVDSARQQRDPLALEGAQYADRLSDGREFASRHISGLLHRCAPRYNCKTSRAC